MYKVTNEQIVEASKQSNSFDFISKYDNQFERDVGNRGD